MASKDYREFRAPDDAAEIRELSFTPDEYARRMHKARQLMAEAELDYLVTTHLPCISWLTGYETLAALAPVAVILPADGDPTLITNDFEAFNTLTTSWIEDVATFPWAGTITRALIDLANDRGLAGKRLGCDTNSLTKGLFDALQDAVDATWSTGHQILERARAQKSPAEIERHRWAGRLTVAGMESARHAVRDGALDYHVANAAYDAIIGGGSERMGLQPIVTVGRRSGIPHTTFRRAPIVAGESVLMEFGACINRYTSPMIRTAFLGEPKNPLWIEMYESCQEAVERTIALMRPGALSTEIAEEASRRLLALPDEVFVDGNRGYSVGLSFPSGWGDCPGLQIATEPWLPKPRIEDYATLKPGFVFHVRAMARHVGWAGVGVSETVAVTEEGAAILTADERYMMMIDK